VLYSDCFKTSAKLAHTERLGLIGDEIEKIIELHKPTVLALETLFFTVNQKTAIKVAEVRGVILYMAQKFGLKVFEYGPLQVKVAVTGYGKSDKGAVISMVQKLVETKKDIRHDDEYDAIALGLTCFATEKFS
jgi:crossover junction endodeoxyribonuclease RuvC